MGYGDVSTLYHRSLTMLNSFTLYCLSKTSSTHFLCDSNSRSYFIYKIAVIRREFLPTSKYYIFVTCLCPLAYSFAMKVLLMFSAMAKSIKLLVPEIPFPPLLKKCIITLSFLSGIINISFYRIIFIYFTSLLFPYYL